MVGKSGMRAGGRLLYRSGKRTALPSKADTDGEKRNVGENSASGLHRERRTK